MRSDIKGMHQKAPDQLQQALNREKEGPVLSTSPFTLVPKEWRPFWALVPEHRATPMPTEVVGLDDHGSSQDPSWSQKTLLPGVSASQRRPEDTLCDVTAV